MVTKEIKKCPLFMDIKETQLDALLICLKAIRRTYNKDNYVFRVNSKASSVGIVLTGAVYVIQEDFWGNRVILTKIKPGGLFGEASSCSKTDKLPVSVIASENSDIMLIDYRKIITTCTSACVFHAQLINNMLYILAEKNIMLTQKIEYLSKRTTKEKLLSFLSHQAINARSNVIEIPYNRQELADYLCVDRSALSRELSVMQKEGLIKYEKNRFELLHNES